MKFASRDAPLKTYLWLTGQTDNIGDSVLRRPYADVLRTASALTVWAGDPAEGYVAGLGLRESEISRSYSSWLANLWKDALVGRAAFAFNPGEFTVTRKGFIMILPALAPIILIRARRRPIIWAGAGVRATRRGYTWPFRFIARSASVLTWREPSSAARIGAGAELAPDWAFGIDASGTPAERSFLALSLRGDRPPPTVEWLQAVRSFAARAGLTPLVVTQVRRDEARSREIASFLGCDIVGWETERHDSAERRVRDVYSRSRVILSDRLHALIIGATEGALPLGWTSDASPKIEHHLSTVGLESFSLAGQESLDALRTFGPGDLVLREEKTAYAMGRARDDLRSLRARIVATFSNGGR
ncbi:polysaccharide pyruvyl transferase family protein [Microbacterium sp. USHLN272]|uniref:polysaccharide pyruvyl transferase family protein n=1 Tax=Microbacterium sp. USHLN272 TaxID=3081287 RepID=UPI003017AD57